MAAMSPIPDYYFNYRQYELECTKSENDYLESCNEIDFYQALTFADMVFNNLFDKICFLKQYCKDYEPCSINTGNNYVRKIVL